jgi:oligopeptide/dipeptide ABC transporter ATP-binding protein
MIDDQGRRTSLMPLLEIKNLKTTFDTEDGLVTALDGVSLSVDKGETVAVVGESGCGKSLTSLAVLRLIPTPPGKIVGGEILFSGEDILTKSEAEMRKIRGKDIAMIFQEPMTSLNPVFTCGNQLMEAIGEHRHLKAAQARDIVMEMLALVGIPMPEQRFNEYPHQMSGGMRQRVMIAMALCCEPKLLIADEPTTALDVTIQAQILDLLIKLKKKMGMAVLLITHDMGVVAETAERVVVMYAGRVIEEAPVDELFRCPTHPYTKGLLDSIPRLDVRENELKTIPGSVPSLGNMPEGCRFHPRCSFASELCAASAPELRETGCGHKVACWLGTPELRARRKVNPR